MALGHRSRYPFDHFAALDEHQGWYSLDVIFDDPETTGVDEGASEGNPLVWKLGGQITSTPAAGSDTASPGANNYPFNIEATSDTCTDNDNDGYGSPGDASCPNGAQTDCNDGDDSIYPGRHRSSISKKDICGFCLIPLIPKNHLGHLW